MVLNLGCVSKIPGEFFKLQMLEPPFPSWGLAQVCMWSEAPCLDRMETTAQGTKGAEDQVGPGRCGERAWERGFLQDEEACGSRGVCVGGGAVGRAGSLRFEASPGQRLTVQTDQFEWLERGHLAAVLVTPSSGSACRV